MIIIILVPFATTPFSYHRMNIQNLIYQIEVDTEIIIANRNKQIYFFLPNLIDPKRIVETRNSNPLKAFGHS